MTSLLKGEITGVKLFSKVSFCFQGSFCLSDRKREIIRAIQYNQVVQEVLEGSKYLKVICTELFFSFFHAI